MKILFVSGGGGHFAPVLSVLDALPKGSDVLVVGRKYTFEGEDALSLEYRIAQERGIAFEAITTGRFQRSFTRHTLPSFGKLPVGMVQSLRLLRRYKPNCIVSFGGYVSLPIVFAGFLLRIPIVLHEQTLHAGLANQIAARFATRICLSWATSKTFFPKEKTVITGNPLRKEIIAAKQTKAAVTFFPEYLPMIFITGGSSGSHAINVLVEGCIAKLTKQYNILHQTGDAQAFKDYDHLQEIQQRLPKEKQYRYRIEKFMNPELMAQVLSVADVVVSRSGINTVTELLYLKKSALLIPLPFAQKNEQRENARMYEHTGLGKLLEQQKLTPELLSTEIQKLLQERADRLSAAIIPESMHEDAAARIVSVVEEVSKQ